MTVRFTLHRVAANRDLLRIKDIVEKVRLARPTVSAIYGNRSKLIALETLDELCKALNCSPGDLLEYVPD